MTSTDTTLAGSSDAVVEVSSSDLALAERADFAAATAEASGHHNVARMARSRAAVLRARAAGLDVSKHSFAFPGECVCAYCCAASSSDLAALRARMASDVECPRCLEVSCVGLACRLADVSDEEADLVTVDEGSGAPMHVVREGVSLEADEAQWRADNAVGLELGRRPLTVDPAAVETQAQFNARQAQGRAERLTRRPVTDPFRRLPQSEDCPF